MSSVYGKRERDISEHIVLMYTNVVVICTINICMLGWKVQMAPSVYVHMAC